MPDTQLGPSLRSVVTTPVVVVLVLLLASVVGLSAILWRWTSGMRRETARGDYSLDGNVFQPPPPGKGFPPAQRQE